MFVLYDYIANSYYSHEDSITSGNPDQVVRSCKRVQNAFLLPLPPSQKLKGKKFNNVQGINNNNNNNK